MHEDVPAAPGSTGDEHGGTSSHSGSQDPWQPPGEIICELRCALGWSQARLAAELGRQSGHPTITREDISRWEHGRRIPRPFWISHLAAALQVPRWALEGYVQRREILRLAGAIAGSAVMGTPAHDAGEELYSSIAARDDGPLARMQTSHETDLMVASLAGADRPVMLRLARWAEDGGSDVLRVNAAGILAKTQSMESAGFATSALRRDHEMRLRYLRAVSARIGTGTRRLAAEVVNPADAGARWCSAWLLGRDGGQAARAALGRALRTEHVAENIRTIGMILNGDDPCS
jgi:transcriptional regulator with XRE-family HTH domain